MNNYLPTTYQQYIHLSKYSRWQWDLGRRETWPETVARYFDFFEHYLADNNNYKIPKALRTELETAILSQQVMPSMRALMTAGPALEKDNIAGYNCSYVAIDHIRAFDEILFILACGTGVGFSVERQEIVKLPTIAEDFHDTETTIIVRDSRVGWAKALRELIAMLVAGQVPNWDVSKVREAGAPLKTFGGRASGPKPLVDLFKFAIRIFKNAAGRKLTSVECHDLICKIGDAIISGGVRRSALISLSNLSDDRMRNAKSGQWWEIEPQRALANNSAVYTEKPDIGIYMDEWKSLYDSKSGERGIFNRAAADNHIEKFGRREPGHNWGVNPCGEIILRSMGFCNLSEVVVRDGDNLDILREKVRLATILGTFQSCLTNFKYIRKKWQENAEEERLLGVSLTGIMDNDYTNGSNPGLESMLVQLREYAVKVNAEYAKKLKISPAAAVTTVKPSGTTSQLVDSASGIHARHSEHYIRRTRADKKDPLGAMMIEAGFPYEDDVTKPDHQWVFSFPIKAPKHARLRTDMTAMDQLKLWKTYRDNWTEHNPSCTISVREDEWMQVGAWVYENFEQIGGLSFLPRTDSIYRQMPYEECSKQEYDELLSKMPKTVDWSLLQNYENTDRTEGVKELACSAGVCEI